MSNPITRYVFESRSDQHAQTVELSLFENNQFELNHDHGGTFGSVCEHYSGIYSFEGENIILSIEHVYARTFLIHDEEPNENTVPYRKILKISPGRDQTLTFDFPDSHWQVTLKRNNGF
jgi:hypothetical protein